VKYGTSWMLPREHDRAFVAAAGRPDAALASQPAVAAATVSATAHVRHVLTNAMLPWA
jgi:hypothetical protein